MNCMYCGFDESKVVDKRDADGSTRRRRECLKCSRRYTTYEHCAVAELFIIKKDGRKEVFNKEKLVRSIASACQKRAVTDEQIACAGDQLEQWLYKQQKKEIKSSTLGRQVLRKLKSLDTLAYLRFTSIHKELELDEFKQEVAKLEVRR